MKSQNTTNKQKEKDLDSIGNLEEKLFDSKLPRNCQVPTCGQPAYKKDLDRKYWCEEHKDRGKFVKK